MTLITELLFRPAPVAGKQDMALSANQRWESKIEPSKLALCDRLPTPKLVPKKVTEKLCRTGTLHETVDDSRGTSIETMLVVVQCSLVTVAATFNILPMACATRQIALDDDIHIDRCEENCNLTMALDPTFP